MMPKIRIDVAADHDIGDIVFLKVKTDRFPGMVTGILVRRDSIVYYVTWTDCSERIHYGFELTSEFLPSFE